jgi:hypothetical protein
MKFQDRGCTGCAFDCSCSYSSPSCLPVGQKSKTFYVNSRQETDVPAIFSIRWSLPASRVIVTNPVSLPEARFWIPSLFPTLSCEVLIAGASRVMGLHRQIQIGRPLSLAIYRQLGCSFCRVPLPKARHLCGRLEVRVFLREAKFFSLRLMRKRSTRSRPQVSITQREWSKVARQTRSGADRQGSQHSQPS